LVWFGYLRTQTPKHIRVGWSHYTDTSEPVDGNEAQNMVTVQSNQRSFDQRSNSLPTALTERIAGIRMKVEINTPKLTNENILLSKLDHP
jgi:hypothetical protein